MNKSFKTVDELITLMRRRGISVDGETARVLMAESYYAVVNGYKKLFLDTQAMQSTAEQKVSRQILRR